MCDFELMMKRAKGESELFSKGFNPNYVVFSDRIGTPCISQEVAEFWYLKGRGVNTQIADLSDYDWNTNPLKLQLHNTSTENGRAALFNTLNPNQVVH